MADLLRLLQVAGGLYSSFLARSVWTVSVNQSAGTQHVFRRMLLSCLWKTFASVKLVFFRKLMKSERFGSKRNLHVLLLIMGPDRDGSSDTWRLLPSLLKNSVTKVQFYKLVQRTYPKKKYKKSQRCVFVDRNELDAVEISFPNLGILWYTNTLRKRWYFLAGTRLGQPMRFFFRRGANGFSCRVAQLLFWVWLW